MRWTVRSERSLYTDQWLDLRVADVELPDGRHLEHRLFRMSPSAGAVVIDSQDRALLIWRHRFITGLWGWEMPMGMINKGETPAQAAAREVEEETGWRAETLREVAYVQPSSGIMDAGHHLFVATDATYAGQPQDAFESARIDWVPLATIPELIAKREIVSSSTMVVLLHLLAAQSAIHDQNAV